MLKRIVVCAVLTAWMLGVSGCVGRSEHDAKKLAELRRQVEQSAKAEKQVLQLQQDLDAAKKEAAKAEQAKKDAEATIKTVQRENGDLKERLKELSPAEEKLSQLQKDFDAAKIEIEKANSEVEKAKIESKEAERAKKEMETKIAALERENAALKTRGRRVFGAIENLSGAWEITYQTNVHAATLEALGSNNYRLGPQNLGFSGVYRFDGRTLSLVGENPRYPDLVWSMKKPGLFEMVAGHYAGASMRRKVGGGSDAGPSKP